MLAFFTALYYSFVFIFVCIGVAFVAHKLYQWCFKRKPNNVSTSPEFEDIQRERSQREEELSRYLTDTALDLRHNSHQVISLFKAQQTHLEKSITDFDDVIAHIKHTNKDLDTSNNALQHQVIAPMQKLLVRVRIHFQQASSLITNLSKAMTTAVKSLSAREEDLEIAVHNIAQAQAKYDLAIEQLPKVKLTADHVVEIESQLSEAVDKLSKLLKKCEQYEEAIKKQKKIIELLKTQNQLPSSYDCRLFGTQTAVLPTNAENSVESRGVIDELHTDTFLIV